MSRRLILPLLLLLVPLGTYAHIGNPTTIYEGLAGTVPVRVSVRVPSVVPGLADINVRVFTNGVTRVTALPVHWRAGVEGAPPPDVCEPVDGEPGLYNAQLWLMARGAYSINVAVEAAQGSGKVVVPINSLATTRLPMTRFLGTLLMVLGVGLFALAVTAVGAAVRESVLDPGSPVSGSRILAGRVAVVAAAGLLGWALYGGWSWWQKVDRDYRNNRMHKPVAARAEVRFEEHRQWLQFTVLPPKPAGGGRASWAPLVPDHGKLMHLFLVRESDMAGFAHLHPLRRGTNLFEALLPPLPAGRYSVYADVTHDTGFSETLTAQVELPDGTAAKTNALSDVDDSWTVAPATQQTGATNAALGDGFTMVWDQAGALTAARETTLRFRVLDPRGEPAEVQPYMSMLSHAIVRRDDGSVFTHLHPAGSISLASQQVFLLRAGEKPPRRITPEMMEQFCQPPGPELRRLPMSFPYEFPKLGRYRIWVQVKVAGVVRTAVFDADVAAG